MAAVSLPKVPSYFLPLCLYFHPLPSEKNVAKPILVSVAKTVKMRSMCQFCWSWSQGSPFVTSSYPSHKRSAEFIYFIRSLTATFSGKIEFSVVSTNGEKVFRKKKSIKVGFEMKLYCNQCRNISGVRHPDWEAYVWTSSCQIHPTQVQSSLNLSAWNLNAISFHCQQCI